MQLYMVLCANDRNNLEEMVAFHAILRMKGISLEVTAMT
jgi:hypothetical protein